MQPLICITLLVLTAAIGLGSGYYGFSHINAAASSITIALFAFGTLRLINVKLEHSFSRWHQGGPRQIPLQAYGCFLNLIVFCCFWLGSFIGLWLRSGSRIAIIVSVSWLMIFCIFHFFEGLPARIASKHPTRPNGWGRH